MSSIPKTELNELLKVIEQTEHEEFREAKETFNKNGIVEDTQLPYGRIVFDSAGEGLCQKLVNVGFSCKPKIIGTYIRDYGNCYAVYNPNVYSLIEAVEWLEKMSWNR